jgi:hypothetical protein
LSAPVLGQQDAGGKQKSQGKNPPPPVSIAPAAPADSRPIVNEQRGLPPRQPLVRQDQMDEILQRFRSAYPAMGRPRLLIYVNRNLVDGTSGIRLIARTEVTRDKSGTVTSPKGETTFQSKRVNAENRYRNQDRSELTLAERLTVREIEQLFGRQLRSGSAVLVDQRIATDMMDSGEFKSLVLEGHQSRKDREALSKFADVAIEVLISSKEIKMPSFNSELTYEVPDIQATAIRLDNAQILGQASSADLMGGNPSPTFARNHGVHEITQATALALMEDMATGFAPAPAAPAAPAP